MKLSDIFQSKAQVKLIEYLLDNAGLQRVFSQASLANFLQMSPSTVARIVEPLVQQKILLYDRFEQGMKIFTLNEREDKTKALIEFYTKLKQM
ncbi:MAG TPA: winged helix-turn-helix domain-containing protein [Candidatus Bathyarchaeia archaeon]|nr:winged helix-turn-helix domain-containing protein [Candidatus Bathyarchaeia archaeon]